VTAAAMPRALIGLRISGVPSGEALRPPGRVCASETASATVVIGDLRHEAVNQVHDALLVVVERRDVPGLLQPDQPDIA